MPATSDGSVLHRDEITTSQRKAINKLTANGYFPISRLEWLNPEVEGGAVFLVVGHGYYRKCYAITTRGRVMEDKD